MYSYRNNYLGHAKIIPICERKMNSRFENIALRYIANHAIQSTKNTLNTISKFPAETQPDGYRG